MGRYFIECCYNGTNYHGWQIQKNALGIQEVVQQALSTVCGKKIEITGSGRTDTGVHALQQVAHFDSDNVLDLTHLKHRLNAVLPPDIAIRTIQAVKEDAHARFSAVKRGYIYRLTREKDPFWQQKTYYFPFPLNLEAMNRATLFLTGEQDFQSFSKVKTASSHFICNIFAAQWIEKGNQVLFEISANRFLRGMVRAIVGTMLEIGRNRLEVNHFQEIINARCRTRAGQSVPPGGLYLSEVKYPDGVYLNEEKF